MYHRASLLYVALLMIGVSALWGCSKTKIHPQARIRHLESRNRKLEEDYRATMAECVQLRKKLANSLKQSEGLDERIEELQSAAEQRDQLQQQVEVCLAQRDAVQVQMKRFQRDLESLVGRVQQVTGSSSNATLATTVSMTTEN